MFLSFLVILSHVGTGREESQPNSEHRNAHAPKHPHPNKSQVAAVVASRARASENEKNSTEKYAYTGGGKGVLRATIE